LSALLAEQMLVLFAILAIGSWLGSLSVRGVSLGTAAVFFVGLAFGHLGLTVPRPIMDLGLLLFVYAVGLQAGPRFFRTFRKQGQQFVLVAAASILAAGVVTVLVAQLFGLSWSLAAGMFTGALTNTPALASAADAVARIDPSQSAAVLVGYGIAYPFSIVGVTLLVQFLPKLLRRTIDNAERDWCNSQAGERTSLSKKQFRVVNANLEGKRLGELDTHRLSQVNISRVQHDDQVVTGTPDVVLHVGDVILAVGADEELEKLRVLVGQEVQVEMAANTHTVSREIFVIEEKLAGKRLMDLHVWDRYAVIITRIRRAGIEITPVGTSTFELGDTLRVVGDDAALDEFSRLVGGNTRKIDETNMVPFLIGILLGIIVGLIPIPLPNGLSIKLGAAGGALLVSLLLGHFGRIGPFPVYVPIAARNISRELGLMLFLAGAGANAGTQLLRVVQEQGGGVFLAGAVITIVAAAVAIIVTHLSYRMNLLSVLGLTSGVMTNPPALAAAVNQTATDVPAVTYASAFPVVLIFKILVAQVLVQVLRLF
jgi:putative transport protein